MAPKTVDKKKDEIVDMTADQTAGFLFAVSVGFLVNLLLGAALPEVGPFIAGLVSGIMMKSGLLKGGVTGLLGGTLGGLASLGLWLTTNLFSLPNSLLPFSFELAILILTLEYAALSLSGGIIGSAIASTRLPNVILFLKHQKPSLPGIPASTVEKKED